MPALSSDTEMYDVGNTTLIHKAPEKEPPPLSLDNKPVYVWWENPSCMY